MGVGKWKRETGNWDLRVALDFGGDAGARFRPGGRRERLEIGKGKVEIGDYVGLWNLAVMRVREVWATRAT
jgi:hypothetical protein